MIRADRITTCDQNGPPPEAAGSLYVGEVMHARLKPFGHRFTYSVFNLLVDIDRLSDMQRQARLLGVNRAGIASFHEADHVEKPGETLRVFVDRLLAASGVRERATRVLLLAYPRILGYVFNPISVYWCYGADGDLVAMIYAVRNTFGQRHAYVAPIEAGDMTHAGVRQTRTKIFHVSPFIDMGTRYHFRVLPPGKVVRLRIHETEAGEALLSATFAGEAKPLTSLTLLTLLAKIPLMTFKVMGGIHWEALKIWLKGGRFIKSPPAPASASYRDHGIHPAE